MHGLPIDRRSGLRAAPRRAGDEGLLVARSRVEHGGLRAQRLRGLKRGPHGFDKLVVVRQSLGQVLVAAQGFDEGLRERVALLVGVAAGNRLAVVEVERPGRERAAPRHGARVARGLEGLQGALGSRAPRRRSFLTSEH